MKKLFTYSIFLVISILLGACDLIESQPQPTPVVYESSGENSLNMVIAEGEVVPAKELQIFASTNAKVEEILVEEGQLVEAGEVILRFEMTEQLTAELEVAKLENLQASQALDDLTLYGNLQKQTAFQRVLDAQSGRRVAQIAWDKFDEDQYNDDLEIIKEDVINARQELDDAKEELKEYLNLEEDNSQRKNRQDDVDEAQLALNESERELEQKEQEYDQLQLNLELTEAELDTAWEEYRKFDQNKLNKDQLSLAEQRLVATQARVTALQSAIEDLQVTAPFAGTIVKIDVEEGESVFIGQPISTVADFSTWYVESIDISELDITDFEIGDSVTLEFDAFDGESIKGEVVMINEFPELKFNDVLYRVRFNLEKNELPLRWKMSVIIKKDK
jgi:multidrug efflux pump subunit AcrA (membrane-fusion protein)